jgi:radical SAM superfamily enzyme YgiQ (UPF0313 family)
MDILFIDPPYMSLKGVSTDCGYNVGLTSLAAYLRQKGIETAVLAGDLLEPPSNRAWTSYHFKDYAVAQRDYGRIVSDKTHVVWKKLAGFVSQTNPMAVGIPYYTPLKYTVEMVASLVREINPDIKIIAGAFHPTFCPEEVMQNPDIDFVVRGEGEIPLLGLVKELKKDSPRWETVPGIYYRDKDGQVRNTPGVNLFPNLDELPFLARDLVLNCDYNVYRGHCMSSTRGCPYSCSFCADKRIWGGRVRRRSVDNFVEELRLLQDTYKVDYVDFVDGTFTFDRKYLETFCNKVTSDNLTINWRCTARIDNIDEDIVKLMKKANCCGMLFGLESGSDRVLKAMNKKTTVEENIRVSAMVYDSGITVATSVLFGLPYETKEDMEATLDLMRRVKTSGFDVNSYTPLPGTPLYDSMSEEDKKNIDWRKVAMKSFDNYFSKTMSQDDFRSYLSQAFEIANEVWKRTLASNALHAR